MNTGTADGENDAKPELQPVDIIPLLKSTDIYASHQMAEKRFQTIQELHTAPTKKRKTDEAAEASSREAAELDMTQKASRSRCTAAIEKIAEEVATSNAMQAKFFQQQSERHAFKQSRNASIATLDEKEISRRSKLAIKAEFDLLVFQKEHGLLNEHEFRAQASRLLAESE